jgi:hypothetical protein
MKGRDLALGGLGEVFSNVRFNQRNRGVQKKEVKGWEGKGRGATYHFPFHGEVP